MNVFFPGRVRHLGALACLAWAMPSLAADALSEITVTAARQAQPRQAALADVTIIDRAELDRAGQDALPQLLARERGVEVASNGGIHNSTSVFIRGANSNQTLVLVDGQRLGSATTGGAALDAVPLAAIERVEILRGPSSSLYGADADCTHGRATATRNGHANTTSACEQATIVKCVAVSPRLFDQKPQLVRCMLARQLLAIDPDRVLDNVIGQVGQQRQAGRAHAQRSASTDVQRTIADRKLALQAIHAERLVAVAHGQKDVVARARGQTNQRWSNDVLQGIDGHGSTPTVGQRRAQCVAIALRDAVKCAHLAQGSEHSMHRGVGEIQCRRQHRHACTQRSGIGHSQQQAPSPGDGLRTAFYFGDFRIVHMVDTSPWLK